MLVVETSLFCDGLDGERHDGATAWLTTDHPASSYGVPVLVMTTPKGQVALGPADLVGTRIGPPESAADIVRRRTDLADHPLVRRFLAAMPSSA